MSSLLCIIFEVASEYDFQDARLAIARSVQRFHSVVYFAESVGKGLKDQKNLSGPARDIICRVVGVFNHETISIPKILYLYKR